MYPLGTNLLSSFALAFISFILAGNFFKDIKLWLAVAVVTFAATAISIALYLEVLFYIIIGIIAVALLICLINKNIE